MNPLASMMNPFMMQQQQMQQMQQMQQPQQAMAAGGGESRQSANESSSSESSDQEVKRIHKENKKNRARQEAAMAIGLATSSGDPDLIPRSCTILRKVPLAACQSTNKQFFKSTLIPEPFPKKPI